ncbi:MAG: hypothetical protein D6815_04510 [Candidatus Dadabacteria bacterium]|nr:MAG: hypothetical protein D6815_04510 [Candidatus Dadabacteria bacterium]
MSTCEITDYTAWQRWVVPKALRTKPVHRWFVFPHSFTDDLVKALIGEWGLGDRDMILDPFVGAGTTLLAAKECGIPAVGVDLSPLAVLASRVKIGPPRRRAAEQAWRRIAPELRVATNRATVAEYPELVRKALPGRSLPTLHRFREVIEARCRRGAERRFFMLALLRILRKFSRAVPTGGWLSWRCDASPISEAKSAFRMSIEQMLEDLSFHRSGNGRKWAAKQADARRIPLAAESVTAVITSPPYPNRHDYTRVFGIELMFGFMTWEQTRRLRYQLFHSHPEARPKRPASNGYSEPRWLTRAIDHIAEAGERDRLPRMLHGYFLDTYLFLREVRRVLRAGGRAAIVIGNAQYQGIPLDVDLAVAEIGDQAGLIPSEVRLVRERGNSAQQMGRFGRRASRESVVIFRR